MTYKNSSFVPKIENLGLNISDLGYHVRQKEENDLDSLQFIEYNQSECNRLIEEIINPIPDDDQFFHNLFKRLEDSKSFKLNLKRHVQRLAIRLDLYSRIKPKKSYIIQPRLYLIYNLRDGPLFADWLSKARSAMTIISLSDRILTDNIKLVNEINLNEYNVKIEFGKRYDYDSLLNERFLIGFKETKSDFHWAFKPIERKEVVLDVFRQASRNLLLKYKAKEIKVADRDDFSTWINDSVTQTSNGPQINRTLLRKLAKEGTLMTLMSSKLNDIPTFKRQVVQVDPGNVRDTWQCFPETLFFVKRTSHILRQVLEELPFSAMASPLKAFQRRRMLKNKHQYFMFDFKKCGLTVNRELITILGEELNYIYPDKGFDELLKFKTVKVLNGDESHYPDRGVGLGNCNEGITLIQCVIGSIVKDRHNINSVFFNDDGVFSVEEGVRVPFTVILSLIRDLGMIINLEKTMISKCNIFCEDYITDKEIDWRKLQLAALPFADCFFKKNIATSKILYYTLQRALIGKRCSIDILSSLIRYYGFEFHSMERLMPFEMGGWNYIGRTTINEVLRFIFDPGLYLGREGSIPFMKEWMGYLIRRHDLVRFLSKSGKIRYREYIENPFHDRFTKLTQSDFALEIMEALGIQSNLEVRENLDALYNYRGSKNAKPRITAGYSDKLLKYRKHLWKNFKELHHRGLILDKFDGQVKMALEYLRGNEVIPLNYLPPEFMVLRTEPLGDYYLKKRSISAGSGFSRSEYSRFEFTSLLESILENRIIPGTKLFSLSNEVRKKKKEYILSDIPFKIPKDYLYHLPDWLYLFVNKKKYALYAYILIYGNRMPVYWSDMTNYELKFDIAQNPIKYIYPKSHKRFKEVLHLRRKPDWRKFVETTISDSKLQNEKEFNLLLESLEKIYPSFLELIEEPTSSNEEDVSFLNILEIDDNLALNIVGEKTDEDLIEEFDNKELIEEDLLDQIYPNDSELPYGYSEEESISDRSQENLSDLSDPDRDLIGDLIDDLPSNEI